MKILKRFVCFLLIVPLIAICLAFDNDFRIKNANSVVLAQKPVIILDAGHGGFDGGAVNGDIIEKDINL